MTETHNLLIEAEQLPHLNSDLIRFVDLSRDSVYQQLHLEQAIHISPKQLLRQQGEITGLLPNQAELIQLIQQLQLSPEHHLIAYDDEGGAWASRLIWTLHCLGFKRTSLINGGIHACLAAGIPTTTDVFSPQIVNTLIEPNFSDIQRYRIEFSELLNLVQQNTPQLWDCRSQDEFLGIRRSARRGGHIPYAIHYEWSNLFDRHNQLKLHPLSHIQQQLQDVGFDLTQPVIVYCQSHHRSSLVYVVGHLLKWDIRAYDGAWSEWGNQTNSPIVTGA